MVVRRIEERVPGFDHEVPKILITTFLTYWFFIATESKLADTNLPAIKKYTKHISTLVVRNSMDTIDTVSIPFGIVEHRYLI